MTNDYKKNISPSMFIGLNNSDIISFGSGQPDIPPPKEIFESVCELKSFKYGLIQGEEKLRRAIAEVHEVDKDEIIVTNGASEALDLCISTILKPKDRILLTRPYYYSYPPLIRKRHIVPVFTELEDGKINIEDIESKIDDVKAVLINSPANPTGSVQSPNTLRQIEDICNSCKKYLIFDEVYESLIYEGEHYSPRGEYVININTFSKKFSMCGHRIGYMYSKNREVVNDVIDLKTHSSMNTNIFAQEMAYAALNVDDSYNRNALDTWTERRNMMCSRLNSLGLDVINPEGAFYVLLKVPEPQKMMIDLFEKDKVIVYLGDWFGAEGTIRLSYALDKEKIENGLDIIERYLD